MKKYVQPDVTLMLLEYHDICAASGGEDNNASSKGNITFTGYGFDKWL